ncbi:hypothetical protein N9D31_02970 [Oligoflexaceae bacterium]|nr:hypothetical protein [Oligoflexaceae bacterium]
MDRDLVSCLGQFHADSYFLKFDTEATETNVEENFHYGFRKVGATGSGSLMHTNNPMPVAIQTEIAKFKNLACQ